MNYQYLIIFICCFAIAGYITCANLYNNKVIDTDVGIYICGIAILLSMLMLILIDSSKSDIPGTKPNPCNITDIQYASDCLFRSIVVFILLYIFYICNFFFVNVDKFTMISFYGFIASVCITLIILLYVIGKETKHARHLIAIIIALSLIVLSALLMKKYIPNYYIQPTYNPDPYINSIN